MRSDHVEISGETANPVVQKARRSTERQAAAGSGLGPTNTPGMPEMPMHQRKRNDAQPSSAPRQAVRRRGAR